jgi:hypothetical protein
MNNQSATRERFAGGNFGVSTFWRRATLLLVAMLAFLHPSLWAERADPEGPLEFIEQLSPDGQFALLREVTASFQSDK